MSEQQSQEYRGNGKHEWESVSSTPRTLTDRLRVPGGWLYRVATTGDINIVFVPMPEVVKHRV